MAGSFAGRCCLRQLPVRGRAATTTASRRRGVLSSGGADTDVPDPDNGERTPLDVLPADSLGVALELPPHDARKTERRIAIKRDSPVSCPGVLPSETRLGVRARSGHGHSIPPLPNWTW
jgi:hypothetical protein